MDCRNVSVKATTKVKLYEGIIDYLPIIILVVGLVVLYVKGKEVRNPTPQVTIDSMSDKTLKQELEEWEPFK